MKVAVLYRSFTGHSKKIARALAAEFAVEALNIKAKPVLSGVDLAFIAGGVYSGKSLPDMLEYLKSLNSDAVKNVALLTSSATNKSGQDEVRQILLSNGVAVAQEEYSCLGNFLFFKMGHPNKKEIADAVAFAKKIKEQLN